MVSAPIVECDDDLSDKTNCAMGLLFYLVRGWQSPPVEKADWIKFQKEISGWEKHLGFRKVKIYKNLCDLENEGAGIAVKGTNCFCRRPEFGF